jgi:hypothetical protein
MVNQPCRFPGADKKKNLEIKIVYIAEVLAEDAL